MLIVVLVRKDLRPHIGDVATDAVPVGLMGLMVSSRLCPLLHRRTWTSPLLTHNLMPFLQGNKAGVAVRMRVHGTYVTFVVAHLAAFADQVEKRRLDYEEITKRLKFPYVPSEASKRLVPDVYPCPLAWSLLR